MRRKGLIVCAAFAGVLASRDARAADARGARWFVDATGAASAGCVAERAAFEHEVTLACAAVGTCHVVDDVQRAELRATLRCAAASEPWVLEVRTVEGALVSSTELAGAREDRLREAAVEVARDQAPERTLAAASLSNTLAEGDRAPLRSWKVPRLSLAIGGAGAVGGIEGKSGGAHALLGLLVANGTHLTLGMTGLLGGSGARSARHLRSGVGIAFGAPFDGSIFGVVLEGGIDVSQSYQTDNVGYFSPSAITHAGAYGQGGFVLSLPIRGIRPYVALLGGAYSTPRMTEYASVDAGLAFPLF